MEDIIKIPGLQHIIQTTLTFLDKNDIASFRMVNQDCQNIVDDPIVFLNKISQLEDLPKDLIENWKMMIKNLRLLHNAVEIKKEITKELFKMFCTTDARYPLELAYKLAETKSNPDLVTAILENSDSKSYVKAPKSLIGNLRPIHIAACFGFVQAARTMLLNFAQVNSQDEYGITPIYLAAQNGHLEMVQELLNFSANPNIANKYRKLPIHSAAREGYVEIVQLLMPTTDTPNAADILGWTSIHRAAEYGHTEVVRLLMETTDNPNAPDNFGKTPMAVADRRGHQEIVKLLNTNKASST